MKLGNSFFFFAIFLLFVLLRSSRAESGDGTMENGTKSPKIKQFGMLKSETVENETPVNSAVQKIKKTRLESEMEHPEIKTKDNKHPEIGLVFNNGENMENEAIVGFREVISSLQKILKGVFGFLMCGIELESTENSQNLPNLDNFEKSEEILNSDGENYIETEEDYGSIDNNLIKT